MVDIKDHEDLGDPVNWSWLRGDLLGVNKKNLATWFFITNQEPFQKPSHQTTHPFIFHSYGVPTYTTTPQMRTLHCADFSRDYGKHQIAAAAALGSCLI
ncbi:hypothetical protein PG985_002230 [Apiospora marii]|uniref:Uncharacterized protein n=1 Tax=Apiospora marii TaxID=335849 RepID=A0ABR1S163_9PEZI